MNRRMALLAAGAIALAGVGAVAARQLGGSRRSEGKVTLKSRILDYNNSIKYLRKPPSQEESDAHVTAMMGEYFYIGMSYDDVVAILSENDLTADEKYENTRDYRFINPPAYFNRSIVSLVRLPGGGLLVTLQYRLILEFKADRLDEFKAAFAGSGL